MHRQSADGKTYQYVMSWGWVCEREKYNISECGAEKCAECIFRFAKPVAYVFLKLVVLNHISDNFHNTPKQFSELFGGVFLPRMWESGCL